MVGRTLPTFYFDGVGRTLVVELESEVDRPRSTSPRAKQSSSPRRSPSDDEEGDTSEDDPSDDDVPCATDAPPPPATSAPSSAAAPSSEVASLAGFQVQASSLGQCPPASATLSKSALAKLGRTDDKMVIFREKRFFKKGLLTFFNKHLLSGKTF